MGRERNELADRVFVAAKNLRSGGESRENFFSQVPLLSIVCLARKVEPSMIESMSGRPLDTGHTDFCQISIANPILIGKGSNENFDDSAISI